MPKGRHIDDLPYGEQRARLGGSPEALRMLAENLQSLPVEKLSLVELSQALKDAEEEIEEVKSTINDCTLLPSNSGDDDELPL